MANQARRFQHLLDIAVKTAGVERADAQGLAGLAVTLDDAPGHPAQFFGDLVFKRGGGVAPPEAGNQVAVTGITAGFRQAGVVGRGVRLQDSRAGIEALNEETESLVIARVIGAADDAHAALAQPRFGGLKEGAGNGGVGDGFEKAKRADRLGDGLQPGLVNDGGNRAGRATIELGDPQLAFPSIHVVGTNGKSTTTRTIEETLLREGLRAGAYTSPHVTGWAERIRVGAEEAVLEQALARVRPQSEALGA